MKNSKIVAATLAIAVLFQSVFFTYYDDLYVYTFALGIKTENLDPMDVLLIFTLLAPVLFAHFYFSESVYRLTHGYGKLYIIRRYSKTKLMLREIGRIVPAVLGIVCFQFLVSYFVKGNLQLLSWNVILLSVLSYALGLFVLVLLQMFLEFFLEPVQAYMAAMLFSFASYCVGHYLSDSLWIKAVFFPCLMFGTQNGAIDNIGYYIASVCILLAAGIFLVLANLYKFKKTDIF